MDTARYQSEFGGRHGCGQDATLRFDGGILPNFVAYATKFRQRRGDPQEAENGLHRLDSIVRGGSKPRIRLGITCVVPP